MKACLINNVACEGNMASISVMDHGLLYGDGVFEGLRYYERRVFRQDAHLDRLFDSAEALQLEVPFSRSELAQQIDKVIAASGVDSGYIRLLVTRGEGSLGIDPSDCRNPQVILIADKLQLVPAERVAQGVKLIIASTRRLAPDQLDPRIKSLNYINNLMARLEANAAGADEAIMLNQSGRVAEGSADNIFVIKNDILRTPPVTEGALEGITRGAIIEAAARAGIDFEEVPLAPFDLYTADACFLTGTGAELIPVREIAGRVLRQVGGDIFSKLETQFHEMVLE